MKISPRYKRYRQKGPQIGAPSCSECAHGRCSECEKVASIFCNCWRSKHSISAEDKKVQMPLANKTKARVGKTVTTKKKGSK